MLNINALKPFVNTEIRIDKLLPNTFLLQNTDN
jgi:hypothetical protein